MSGAGVDRVFSSNALGSELETLSVYKYGFFSAPHTLGAGAWGSP